MDKLKYYFAGSYKIRILLGSLFAVVVAGGVITRFLVHNGIACEGNLILEYWVMEDKFLSIKILGGLLAALYLWSIYRRYPRVSIGFTSLFVIGYTFIVIWNLLILV